MGKSFLFSNTFPTSSPLTLISLSHFFPSTTSFPPHSHFFPFITSFHFKLLFLSHLFSCPTSFLPPFISFFTFFPFLFFSSSHLFPFTTPFALSLLFPLRALLHFLPFSYLFSRPTSLPFPLLFLSTSFKFPSLWEKYYTKVVYIIFLFEKITFLNRNGKRAL